jgi:hypothetical protein
MGQVVGLLGAKGAGKDTCAHYLVSLADFIRVGFADALYNEVSQAYGVAEAFLNNRDTKETPLKALRLANCNNLQFVETALRVLGCKARLRRQALAALVGRVPAHAPARRIRALLNAPRSPRWTMQLWGTEYRRRGRYGVDSYWLDIVATLVQGNPQSSYVITDVRFINEAEFVRSMGGTLVRIRRPELEAREAANRARGGSAAHPSETELLTFVVDREFMNVEGQPESLRDAVIQLVRPLELAA